MNALPGEPLTAAERAAAADRCHRALYLHLGNHRFAEGGQGQPLPAHAVEPLVCRHDGYQARGPHVQLPAAVSQRRRRGGDVCDAGGRRRGGDSPALLGVGFLARRARRALHLVPVHRRAVPLPGECARSSQIETGHALRMACGNGLRPEVWEPFQNALSNSRESSSITPPPKAIFRSTTARDSPAPSAASRRFWRAACRWRCCDSTLTKREPWRNADGLLRALRGRMRSARPSA